MMGRKKAGVGTTFNGASGMGASRRAATNSRARSISRAYAATSASAGGWSCRS